MRTASHNLAEAGHVEHETLPELQSSPRRDGFAERKNIQQAPIVVLHPMWQACAGEVEVGETVLEALEVVTAFDDDRYVGVIGHAAGPGLEQEFGNQRPHDTERDTQLAKTAHKIGHHRDQARLGYFPVKK